MQFFVFSLSFEGIRVRVPIFASIFERLNREARLVDERDGHKGAKAGHLPIVDTLFSHNLFHIDMLKLIENPTISILLKV